MITKNKKKIKNKSNLNNNKQNKNPYKKTIKITNNLKYN